MEPAHDTFLGTGWGFPPEWSLRSKTVRQVSGADLIRESLWILLSTRLGERVMNPEYGCNLASFVFHDLTPSLIEQIRAAVDAAIRRWEPRVELEAVCVSEDVDTPGLLLIDLTYRLRGTHVACKFVYPLYFSAASRPESNSG